MWVHCVKLDTAQKETYVKLFSNVLFYHINMGKKGEHTEKTTGNKKRWKIFLKKVDRINFFGSSFERKGIERNQNVKDWQQ